MNEVTVMDPARNAPVLAEPVFFMHIAKTAGSYVNVLLQNALGAPHVATHIESRIGSSADLMRAYSRGVQVFSGHVMHGLWHDIAAPTELCFKTFTLLRDPIEHLASHLLWLDHYNRPEKRKEYLQLDEAHRRISDRIAAIDLTDVGQLDAYLTSLSGHEVRLFDNCQARYFLMSGRRDMEAIRPLSLADAKALRQAAAKFDAIGFQDRLEEDVPRLAKAVGIDLKYLEKRVNPAQSSRKIDTSNPLVRQILSKRTIVDQWLWRHARLELGTTSD
ncbi:MAG: hypothetical protein KJO30_12595 [Boseongicola sp.]|nr:hypothetical protein [Boseongicola sp.]NNJ68868.1 hypothetical protein [Boseongicola sp.]